MVSREAFFKARCRREIESMDAERAYADRVHRLRVMSQFLQGTCDNGPMWLFTGLTKRVADCGCSVVIWKVAGGYRVTVDLVPVKAFSTLADAAGWTCTRALWGFRSLV